jgi:hypothetical protein
VTGAQYLIRLAGFAASGFLGAFFGISAWGWVAVVLPVSAGIALADAWGRIDDDWGRT